MNACISVPALLFVKSLLMMIHKNGMSDGLTGELVYRNLVNSSPLDTHAPPHAYDDAYCYLYSLFKQGSNPLFCSYYPRIPLEFPLFSVSPPLR